MSFYDQFKTFDPLSGDVPAYPFSCLPAIAQRARSLLGCRKVEQITLIAETIDYEIDRYFSDIKFLELEKLREQSASTNGTVIEPESFDEDDLDIPSRENSNEVDTLKTVIEERDGYLFFLPDGTEPEGYPEGKDFEFFAVLSLWLLSDTLSWLNRKGKYTISIAGETALKAMDAVCYAEHLHESAWLTSYLKKNGEAKLEEALRKQKSEQQEWIRYCMNMKKERERKKRTEQSKKMNSARHRKTNEAKHKVIEEWANDKSRFPSAEKAGLYLADWLEKQGLKYEPRTVTQWIRKHAKETGVKLR